jgi:hypothetical protein
VPIGASTIEKNHPTEVIILRWPTFHDAAYEAGISRLYGGIHIQDGNLRGREMGEQVGVLAYEHAERYWSGHVE